MINNLGHHPLKPNETLSMLYQMVAINLITIKEKDIVGGNKKNKNVNFDFCTNIKDYDVNITISLDDITNALKDDEVFHDYIHKFDII